MPSVIKLEAIGGPEPIEIIQVDSGFVTVGREPENTIVVDSESVSRRHGCVFSAGSQWVFQDFGSTNGSRVNNIVAKPGHFRVLRHGDIILLSDFGMRFSEVERANGSASLSANPPSLLVFSADGFENEFFLESDSVNFVVGGPNADLILEGESQDFSQAVIDFRPKFLELTIGQTELPILVNGNQIRGACILNDRDEIELGPVRIVVNDPRQVVRVDEKSSLKGHGAVRKDIRVTGTLQRPDFREELQRSGGVDDSWGSSSRPRGGQKNFVFGSQPVEGGASTEGSGSQTLSLESYRFRSRTGFETSPSQRFADTEEPHQNASGEWLRVILGIFIVCLFVAVAIFIVGILAGA